MREIFYSFIMIWWISGIVLANGLWSTFFSIFCAPWAMYLVVEKIFQSFGVI